MMNFRMGHFEDRNKTPTNAAGANPTIEWRHIRGTDCLYFTFMNELTESDARMAIVMWKQQFAQTKDVSYVIVWNCIDMSGYEPQARALWQDAMKVLKPRIESIWLISESRMIRQGARIMSLFTSFEIHAVASESELGF